MVYDMTRRFEEAGHEVIIFSMQHPDNWQTPYASYFMPNVEYSEGSSYGLWRKIEEAGRIIYSFEAKRRIGRLIRDTKPDIAHLHNIYHQLSPSIIHALRKNDIPIIMSLHDYKLICPAIRMFVKDCVCERCVGGKFYNSIKYRCVKDSLIYSLICCVEAYIHRILKIYHGVDLFISPSNFLREKMIMSGIPAEKIVTQHVAVELSQFRPTEKGNYVLFIGMLSKVKGVFTLTKAAEKLPNIQFCFAGEGEARADIETIIKQKNLNNVILAGFKAGKDLINLIQDSSVVVVPSEWFENCPRTVLEGFACGKPVIGSRIGGIPELINEGVDGYLFEPGNAEELAEKISTILTDEKRRIEMGRAGRRKMEEQFSPDAFYDGTLDIYRQVAGIR